MALPAGRYGVTKNQLLKIKKLPMNTIKLIEELTEKFNLLGTAAFKSSTSVVTDSTDLVESGAVKDALGFGTKNLLPNTAISTTKSDVTYIVNDDGTVNINGTPSVSDTFIIGSFNVKQGVTYTISSDVVDSDTTHRLWVYNENMGSSVAFPIGNRLSTDNSDDKTRTAQADETITVAYQVFSGQALNNITLKPMIEKGSTATAYEPYHASVEESLEQKCDNSVIGTVEDGTTASQAYAVGEHFIKDGQFKEVTQAIASGGAISDSNTVNKPIAEIVNNIYMYRGILSANTDLDTYNTVDKAGIYGCDGNALTNKPSDFNGYGQMFVYTKGGLVMQEIKGNGVQYTRIYAGGSWRNWFKYTGTEML